MHSIKINFFLLSLILFLAINQVVKSHESTDSRSFYLGFTYQPYDWSEHAFEETYSFIDKNSDMIFHYFDDGIPWEEAFSGTKYHHSVESELNKRIDHISKNQKVTLGINFLAKDRRALASYWGKEDSLPRPGKWATRGINHPDVITSYVSYCRSMIKRFNPDFFIYGMEVDSVELDIVKQRIYRP